MKLSVVVPAYNEESRIENAINCLSRYFNKLGMSHEIIVVNDASSDGTVDIVKKKKKKMKNLRLISLKKNQWKGGAVKAGMLASRGELVLMSDADLATPLKEFEKLFQKIKMGFEIAIASRGLKKSRILQGSSFYRETLSKLFGLLTKLLVMWGITDPQCGFKLFTRKAVKKIFPRKISPTPLWDIDVLVYAAKQGFRIAETPVSWSHDPDTRLSYNFRKSIVIFRELLKIRKKHRIVIPIRVTVG